jgi:hypothetical protein
MKIRPTGYKNILAGDFPRALICATMGPHMAKQCQLPANPMRKV